MTELEREQFPSGRRSRLRAPSHTSALARPTDRPTDPFPPCWLEACSGRREAVKRVLQLFSSLALCTRYQCCKLQSRTSAFTLAGSRRLRRRRRCGRLRRCEHTQTPLENCKRRRQAGSEVEEEGPTYYTTLLFACPLASHFASQVCTVCSPLSLYPRQNTRRQASEQ